MGRFFSLILLFAASLSSYEAKDYSHLFGMPGFSDNLLKLHFTLYQGYVNNANQLLSTLQEMNKSGASSTYEYGALKRRFGWEFDGMRLHELYFDNLGGKGTPDLKGPLCQAIVAYFGSFDLWKQDFLAVGSMRGIGWAVLYFDLEQKRLINVWINEHDVGHLAGGQPLLVMDVFEHAYMPQYGLDKAKYLQAFFQNIDWPLVEDRFTGSKRTSQ